jgi:hypothetical protein
MVRDTDKESIQHLKQLDKWALQLRYDKCNKLLTDADIEGMDLMELVYIICIMHRIKSRLEAWPDFYARAIKRTSAHNINVECRIARFEQCKLLYAAAKAVSNSMARMCDYLGIKHQPTDMIVVLPTSREEGDTDGERH